jgi:hypothetical protein
MKGLGLNNDIILKLDKKKALNRIEKDIHGDFIFAPHLNIVFHKCGDELFDLLTSKLRSGTYTPLLPITIDVIKPNGFHRPGSILEPIDRMAYQLITDLIAPYGEKEIDRTQVLSHKLLEHDEDGFMYEKSNESYQNFKNRVQELCDSGKYKYVLRADIASYFDRIYQHIIGNLLYSTDADKEAISFLEKFLLSLSQNDSHGIIQGVFPSDFLGNFSLCDIDAQHNLEDLEFARYVDDFYIFFKELNDARTHKIKLSNWLRRDGLNLNENKTRIYKVKELMHEETEIDRLFKSAKDEVLDGLENLGYETNIYWDLDTLEKYEEDEINTEATKALFNTSTKRDVRLKIERFCLPVFSLADSDFPLEYVIENYAKEPSMSQTYFGYLNRMIRLDNSVAEKCESIFNDKNLIFDYQRKWLYAAFLYSEKISEKIINNALADLKKTSRNVGLRALCAIIIGKYGNPASRRILKNFYSNENSEYVKSAILFASQYFPPQERDTCFKAWSGHSELNSLIVQAIKKK